MPAQTAHALVLASLLPRPSPEHPTNMQALQTHSGTLRAPASRNFDTNVESVTLESLLSLTLPRSLHCADRSLWSDNGEYQIWPTIFAICLPCSNEILPRLMKYPVSFRLVLEAGRFGPRSRSSVRMGLRLSTSPSGILGGRRIGVIPSIIQYRISSIGTEQLVGGVSKCHQKIVRFHRCPTI